LKKSEKVGHVAPSSASRSSTCGAALQAACLNIGAELWLLAQGASQRASCVSSVLLGLARRAKQYAPEVLQNFVGCRDAPLSMPSPGVFALSQFLARLFSFFLCSNSNSFESS